MNSLLIQNMNYKLIIFDFDGTIADTSPGIIDSHKFTLESMRKSIPSDNELLKIIGGQLIKIYREVFQFDYISAKEAIKIYRTRYAEVGINLANIYEGFPDLIDRLKENGFYVGVATLKADRFARIMLEKFDLLDKFDAICGVDERDSLTKSDLIQRCMKICGVNRLQTILVGDSINDLKGAKNAGVYFIGVTYGFGFKEDADYDFDIAHSPGEVYSIVSKLSH